MKGTLECEHSEDLVVKVNMMKQIGSVLLREGFRLILREDHSNEIMEFINSFKLLQDIMRIGDEWLINSLKFLIIGVKDPLVFLCQCIEKMRMIELSRKS